MGAASYGRFSGFSGCVQLPPATFSRPRLAPAFGAGSPRPRPTPRDATWPRGGISIAHARHRRVAPHTTLARLRGCGWSGRSCRRGGRHPGKPALDPSGALPGRVQPGRSCVPCGRYSLADAFERDGRPCDAIADARTGSLRPGVESYAHRSEQGRPRFHTARPVRPQRSCPRRQEGRQPLADRVIPPCAAQRDRSVEPRRGSRGPADR